MMSRTNKVIKNSTLNFSFNVMTICLTFFSRKIFIDYLGNDLIGLNSTLQNILGFLNLAESGIAISISYALYQPLFNSDKQQIKEIVSILKSLYGKVGYIILGGAVVLSFFLPVIFGNTGVNLIFIYSAFFVFLLSSLIGYFLNYRQILMRANQQEYVIITTFKLCTIIKIICQIIALTQFESGYFIWLFIELSFNLIYSYILNIRINTYFPWLKVEKSDIRLLRQKYSFIVKKIKQVFFHQAAGFILLQTTALFVFIFTDLSTVTKYTNYTLITVQITTLLSALMNSTFASVGNLVAEGKNNHALKVFGELITLRFYIAFLTIFCLYNLIEPFISIWLGNEFILDRTILILILISTFITLVRGCVDSFISAHGLFHDVWATCTEAAINIIVCIIAGYYWGLKGVALGPVVCTGIFVVFWKPYFLFRNGFKLSVFVYWKIVLRICIVNGFIFIICCYFIQKWSFEIKSFFHFFKFSVLLFASYATISFIASSIAIKGMRDFFMRVMNMFEKRITHE